MTNKTKTLVLGMMLLGAIVMLSFASADLSSLVYTDSTQYSPSSHSYDIINTYTDYITVELRGTANGEIACLVFLYEDGSNYTNECQPVPYLSWSTKTYTNPNPGVKVAIMNLNGGTHTYMRNLNVYGYAENFSGAGQTTCLSNCDSEDRLYCGDGKINGNETCDLGEMNGALCEAGYNSFCDYCSNKCQITKVIGEHCGDGTLNPTYEKCDDGNLNDNDGCSSQCKKPFQVTVEDFAPIVWQCAQSRVVYDDATEPGRISEDGQELIERINNYAFEGEQIQWKVLIMDKNGIEKVKDVYATVNDEVEANCRLLPSTYFPKQETLTESVVNDGKLLDPSCNARILEEKLTTFDPQTMAYYLCTLTVETPESPNFYGQQNVGVEIEDIDGQIGQMDERESWFFNPSIALSVDGDIAFDNVRPGTDLYSSRILVGNDADMGSGVILDMFISGTDFYDSTSSGAKCPDTNQLSLKNFRYYASMGGYSTRNDLQIGRTCDAEGYCSINYGIGFNNPKPFYDKNEIIQAQKVGPYYTANTLSQGSEMTLIFRLNLPEPCNGDFDTGDVYFWGEAI